MNFPMVFPIVPKKTEVPLIMKSGNVREMDLGRFNQKISTFIPAFKSQYKDSFDKIKYKTTFATKKKKLRKINLSHPRIIPIQKNQDVIEIINKYNVIVNPFYFKEKVISFIKEIKFCLKKIDVFSINKKISQVFKQANHYLNIMGLLIIPFDNGRNRIGLLFRSKKVQGRKKKFTQKLNEYIELKLIENDVNSIRNSEISDDIIDLENYLDRELIAIPLEENSINTDYKKFLLGCAKYFVSNFAFLVAYAPLKSLIDLAVILGKIPGLIELFDSMLLFFNLKKSKENKNIYNIWQENFSRNNHVNLVRIPRPDSNSVCEFANHSTLKEMSDYLLNNRCAIEEKISKGLQSDCEFEKLKALKDRKILKLVNLDIDLVITSYFSQLNQGKLSEDELNKKLSRSKIVLLNEYVDEQIVLEIKAKAKLAYLIKSKLKLEKIFIDFNHIQSGFSFGYSALELSMSIIGGVLGSMIGPTGTVTGMVIGLYVSSIVLNLSFWLSANIIGSKYRSHSSGLLNMKILFRQVKYDISNYWLHIKERGLYKKNPKFLEEIPAKPEAIEGITKKEIKGFIKLNNKTQKLFNSLEILKSLRRENELIDFKKFADLPEGYFKELIDIIELLNFDLAENDLNNILKLELGLDVEKLAKDLNSDSNEVKEHAIKTLLKDLESFFTLKENNYVSFMKYQNKGLDLGVVKP